MLANLATNGGRAARALFSLASPPPNTATCTARAASALLQNEGFYGNAVRKQDERLFRVTISGWIIEKIFYTSCNTTAFGLWLICPLCLVDIYFSTLWKDFSGIKFFFSRKYGNTADRTPLIFSNSFSSLEGELPLTLWKYLSGLFCVYVNVIRHVRLSVHYLVTHTHTRVCGILFESKRGDSRDRGSVTKAKWRVCT